MPELAQAQVLPAPPGHVPVPYASPFAPTATRQVPAALVKPDPVITSGIVQPERPGAIDGTLKTGLDALYGKDARRAMAIRNGMPRQSLDRQILTWAIGLSGANGVSSADIAEAAEELQGWPGMAALRRNSEYAIYKENPPARVVISAFGNTKPKTSEGMIILARAYLAEGNRDKARQVLAPAWRNEKLDAGDEQLILREFGQVLTRDDHMHRMLRMLYANRIQSAGRVAKLANAQSLYEGFAAVAQKSPNAEKKLAAVDSSWRSNPAYIFARIQYLRRKERYSDAAELMLKAPRDAASLVDPDAWWNERRLLSRELLDLDKPEIAYRLASAHAAETPAMAAEAEFHAGWYALRGLKDAKAAHRHFARIAEISSRPMSASRAYYWLGRAAEAGAGGDSRNYYRRAAHYGTTFYGQLAAAKLGEARLELPYPKPTTDDRARFEHRHAVQAIRRLEAIGYGTRADMLYRDLAQELDSTGEVALLAVMAERNGKHYVALRVGKAAAARGLDVGALSHPIGAIPDSADIKGSGKALAYAIARQESEFNVSAVSSAGARGLLQLLPTTAKEVAQRAGMSYSKPRLTTDAAYNATLGSHFLGEQIDRFDGSYILTFAGYNAGPRRAAQWMDRYGDPRGKPIDEVVDWIERIPYTETRNYVQRVMENYEVYKARLDGKMDIEKDLVQGRN
ncbi:lytic transglycosylase domain-containing protein [Phyllobacterium salinisoli]|uniref:Lytic transglycosylase domain-containing protein n=1 Tax=Phyllobacterium salinisoli TaxID=1899321 RepID=A0A368K2A8_9HYPH|nr:lytic transglycosylase domain-containing protein [Phyllobacterium salinisoli]RCS23527.1 lytic transglycosylase domain-containing protein [Phyllobacterium salinisoli]